MLFDKGSFLTFAGDRCLNRRYRGLACDHCKSLCPSNAIDFDENGVVLDKGKCSGCGVCFSECPTQVFGSSRWDETSIVEKIAERGWKVTDFFCGRHSLPRQDDQNPERGAIRLPACLGILTRGCWYEAGLTTQVEVRLDQCEKCSLAKVLPRLKYNIETAAEWLTASGHPPRFNLIHQSHQRKMKQNLKAVEAGLKVTSRRDLFLSLVKAGRKETADELPGAGISSSRLQAVNSPGHCLPIWRKRLAEVYSKQMIEDFPPAHWPAVVINSQCMHCGLCVLLCPSGALQRIIQDGICSYHFTSGLCLDCRICQAACEQKAISREREKILKPFETTCVYSSPVDECRRCGGVTADSRTQLCYRCAQEASIDHEFKAVCGSLLMRDED